VYEYKELKQSMIRFTKFLSIFLFVLLFSNSNVYSYGDPDQILCGQWLWKNVLKGKGSCPNAPFCKVGAFDTDSGREENIASNQDYERLTYYVEDDIGKQGICRDYFPDGLQREMFYRNSDKPLDMELKFVRQFCGWRWWDNTTNCGMPGVKGVWYPPFFEWDWSKGAKNGDWSAISDVNLTFSLQERGQDNYQTVVWGLNYAYIDYEQLDNKDNPTKKSKADCEKDTPPCKDNPKRICVFYATSWLSGIFKDSEQIGCIDIPLNPSPDIYNKILVPKKSVIVDGGTPSGSTFMNPKINLQVIDSTGQAIGGPITLGYDYSVTSVTCSDPLKTLGDTYCPFVPPDDSAKICAGLQDKSSSKIGCIDRPKPSGSIIIDTVHDYYIDNNCPDINNKPSIFHSIKIQLKDSGTKKVIKEFPDDGLGLRDYYACYRQNTDLGIKDKMIVAGKDLATIYGVKFSAIIPKFVDIDKKDVEDYKKIGIEKIRPENFRQTYMYPLIMKKSSQVDKKDNLGSCDSCFYFVNNKSKCTYNNPTSKQDGQNMCTAYNTPAGERDRSSCAKDNKCYDFKHNPMPTGDVEKNLINCRFGSDASKLNEAEKAYCPGVYKLHQNTERNAICINLDTKWPVFFGPTDRICAEIPASFMSLGKEDISSLTGYIDFTNDELDPKKKYKDNETDSLYGVCDASLNLERKKCLSSDGEKCLTIIPDKIEGLTDDDVVNFKGKYIFINKYLYGNKEEVNDDIEGINANVQAIDKKLMINLGYASSKQEFSTISVSDERPYRVVGDIQSIDGTSPIDDNFPIGIIHNGCRFTVGEDGCGKNTKTVPFLGNAIFDTSNLHLNIDDVLTITNFNVVKEDRLDKKLTIKDIPIEGKCKDGFVPASEGSTFRICRVIVGNYNKIITKSWSDQVIINPCVKDKS